MMARGLSYENVYLPNMWVSFGAALSFHVLLFAWNPVILSAGNSIHPGPPILQVQFQEKMPPIIQPVKAPPKPIVKPVVKKAKKSGISINRHHAPIKVTRHQPAPTHARPAPHRYASKVSMPTFVPHESDEPRITLAFNANEPP